MDTALVPATALAKRARSGAPGRDRPEVGPGARKAVPRSGAPDRPLLCYVPFPGRRGVGATLRLDPRGRSARLACSVAGLHDLPVLPAERDQSARPFDAERQLARGGLALPKARRHAVNVSDLHLRELEAAWRASGSVEDEAAYLRERVRVGDLSEERLKLAEYLRGANGEAGPEWVRFYVEDLERWGKMTPVRAGIAVARWLVDQVPGLSTTQPNAAIDSAEEFVAGPNGSRWRVASALGEQCWRDGLVQESEGRRAVLLAACECARAAAYAGVPEGVLASRPLPLEAEVRRVERKAARSAGCAAWHAADFAFRTSLPLEQILGTIRSEILPWALGTGDAVHERVEARQREAARE